MFDSLHCKPKWITSALVTSTCMREPSRHHKHIELLARDTHGNPALIRIYEGSQDPHFRSI